jgi:hypothetical protein
MDGGREGGIWDRETRGEYRKTERRDEDWGTATKRSITQNKYHLT